MPAGRAPRAPGEKRSSPDRFATLRRVLVTVGVLVWAPYLLAKYALHSSFPVGWVLVVHIPCMVGALVLRLLKRRLNP